MLLLLINSLGIYSQDFSEALLLKLPKPDQYKILKARTFYTKGRVFLAKSREYSDSIQINNLSAQGLNDLNVNEYYAQRINASYCFKTSNGLYFNVLDKYIKIFWKNHPNDKQPLGFIVKVENASYDSLMTGDKLRGLAERKTLIKDKIPLVSRAENLEEKALFNLSKVLYVYFNWPLLPDTLWLISDERTDPYIPGNTKNISLNINNKDTITSRKDTLHQNSNIYNLLHISENQIDKFNEFLKQTHPDKMDTYLVNFQKIYDSTIDSLHIEWRKYLASGIVAPDTLKAKDFIYKVQIAASRNKMSVTEQKKIYTGTEIIEESFEDQWYKYTIGSFESYNSAHKYKEELKNSIKGVFVIAYYKGKRIKINSPLTNR